MMNEEEFATLLARGYETRGVEFKGPRSRSEKAAFAPVARAMLGMANHQDGGLVVIGVDENNHILRPTGLSETDLGTWVYDDVAAAVNEYASPSVVFDLEIVTHNGVRFVVLRVHEFEDIPVLCSRDYQSILRRGACYVRSRHKPETSEIPSEEEMRALLSAAVQKGLDQWVKQALTAGLIRPVGLATTVEPSAESRFDTQRGGF